MASKSSNTQPSTPLPAEPENRSNVQDLPEYWNYPNYYRGSEQPITPVIHYPRRGGVHLSWPHYLGLCFAIFCMGFVLTLWTAVALHRTEPSFQLATNYVPQSAQGQADHHETPPLWEFKPNFVIEKAHTDFFTATVTDVETVTIMIDPNESTSSFVPSTTLMVSVESLSSSPTVDSKSPLTSSDTNSGSMTSSSSSSPSSQTPSSSFRTSISTSSSSLTLTSTTAPADSTVTASVTKWSMTTMQPSVRPIKPSTRHFGMPS
ncbi:hypothetical protein BT63DRAFT_162530 [Microthyrium microscopicum]|uniref:Uncharacterized protein n=1 Tax=Microthyrium microscopicum TaxID=703497 RepID=A0A6A6URU3_9PEZI|nr:hypothetical protein BT63DRAFT_162530 [Microthyrium microscopicum]